MDQLKILKILERTRLLRPPRRLLATFGDTEIRYYLLSDVEDLADRCRIREGKILAHKPKILTLDALQKRFSGFGSDAREYVNWILEAYHDVLRVLEYNFKNQMETTKVLRQDPKILAEKIQKDLDGKQTSQAAVLLCPDAGWQLALMKFVIDEIRRSYPTQLREMEERDLFNPQVREEKTRRQEIEGLFKAASQDRFVIKTLGEKLNRYGLFQEYEDRFFSLLS
ncbi:MAG: hypothetical protein HY399_00745 [Elusimicrobia bacterium]|nr:hypothetical protein [Elusimicrobiota bacterium]